MGSETKRWCDRCNKQMKEPDPLLNFKYGANVIQKTELCFTCYEKLMDLIKTYIEEIL